jgi:hypothetical protein
MLPMMDFYFAPRRFPIANGNVLIYQTSMTFLPVVFIHLAAPISFCRRQFSFCTAEILLRLASFIFANAKLLVCRGLKTVCRWDRGLRLQVELSAATNVPMVQEHLPWAT